MQTQYFKNYSSALGRDMEFQVYGYAGQPVLYIPCQDGRFFDFGDFHMAETLLPGLNPGRSLYSRWTPWIRKHGLPREATPTGGPGGTNSG